MIDIPDISDDTLEILATISRGDHIEDLIRLFKAGRVILYKPGEDSKAIEIDYSDPDIIEKFKARPYDYTWWDHDYMLGKGWGLKEVAYYRDGYRDSTFGRETRTKDTSTGVIGGN